MNEENKKGICREKARFQFEANIARGYLNPNNIRMQCSKYDYEMMEAGLNVFLNTPVNLGGAGGNNQATIIVRDKNNNPNSMTIEAAMQLGLEMKMYYWSLWARKGVYYDALMACSTIEEMNIVVF